MLEAFLAPSPLAGEGRGEGDGGTTDGLVHRLWPNESPLSLPSPARGEGELSLDLPGLYGSFNGIAPNASVANCRRSAQEIDDLTEFSLTGAGIKEVCSAFVRNLDCEKDRRIGGQRLSFSASPAMRLKILDAAR